MKGKQKLYERVFPLAIHGQKQCNKTRRNFVALMIASVVFTVTKQMVEGGVSLICVRLEESPPDLQKTM
jgi:fructose-1,6-bisphosphatase